MALGSIFHRINLPLFPLFLLAFFTFTSYHKNTKNIILSSLADLTLVSEGIDNPFIALRGSYLFV